MTSPPCGGRITKSMQGAAKSLTAWTRHLSCLARTLPYPPVKIFIMARAARKISERAERRLCRCTHTHTTGESASGNECMIELAARSSCLQIRPLVVSSRIAESRCPSQRSRQPGHVAEECHPETEV